MGAPEFYPSPAHSPSLSTGSWSSIARKNNGKSPKNNEINKFRKSHLEKIKIVENVCQTKNISKIYFSMIFSIIISKSL
jgi:hypothetical protein